MYDITGNILKKEQMAVGTGTGDGYIEDVNLTYTNVYEYTGGRPHAVSKAGNMTYQYDANGNLIKRTNTKTNKSMTLTWDEENRLKRTVDALHTTDYRYDANGERIIKKSELGETVYVNAMYTVRDVKVISRHIFAGSERIVSKVYSKSNGILTLQNELYYHPDHLGSSSCVTDKKGNFYETTEYLPYGETWIQEKASNSSNPYLYCSKEQDAETGLYYYGARYYDPKIGRFISVDSAFDGLNLYAYCDGNPIMYNDPTGHFAQTPEDAKNKEYYGSVRPADTIKLHVKSKSADSSVFTNAVVMEDGGALEVGGSGVQFSIEETGENFKASYETRVEKKTGFDVGVGFSVGSNSAEKEFSSGTSPEDIAKDYAKIEHTDSVSFLFLSYTDIDSEGWKGEGVGVSLGKAPWDFSYSRKKDYTRFISESLTLDVAVPNPLDYRGAGESPDVARKRNAINAIEKSEKQYNKYMQKQLRGNQ